MIELFLDCERFSLSQHEAFRILNLGVIFADFCNFFAAFDKKQVFGFGKRRIPQDGKFDWEQDDPSLHSPKFCHFPTLEITVQSFDCIMSAHHKFPGLILIYPKTEIQWQHHLQLQTNRCHLWLLEGTSVLEEQPKNMSLFGFSDPYWPLDSSGFHRPTAWVAESIDCLAVMFQNDSFHACRIWNTQYALCISTVWS